MIHRAAVAVSLLLLSLGIAPTAASSRETTGGYGKSYWGPIPAPADSVTATAGNLPRPAWEYPLLVPYQAVNIPLRLTFGALGATFVYVQESRVAKGIAEILGPREVPWGFVLNVRAGALAGTGGGISLYHDDVFSPKNRLKIRTLYTIRNTQAYSLGALFNEGGAVGIEIGAGYRLRPNARFFGIGPDSREADKSYYTQETSWVGVSLSRRLADRLRVEGSTVYSGVGARGAEDDEPKIGDVFGQKPPFGLNDLSEGITAALALSADYTQEDGRPENGTVVRLKGTSFTGTARSDVAFFAYRAEIEQFVPLWHSERVLALRGVIDWIDNRGDRPVPFQRLMTNDEPDLFRGFDDFRWRDRAIAAVSAEYRFPFWALSNAGGTGIDAYLLSDVGQVFHDFDQIGGDRITVSYGGGFRLILSKGFVARFEVGASDEDVVFRLQTDQIFQYAKGGLYSGRDKTVLR